MAELVNASILSLEIIEKYFRASLSNSTTVIDTQHNCDFTLLHTHQQEKKFGSLCTMLASPIIIIINKVLIKVTLNKVIAGALYIVICG